MDPQEDPTFPIPTWQTTLEMIKDTATAMVEEPKNQHSGDQEALAKNLACENQIKGTKCWRQYKGKEKKIFFEFSCLFRIKCYDTSGTSSPFILI